MVLDMENPLGPFSGASDRSEGQEQVGCGSKSVKVSSKSEKLLPRYCHRKLVEKNLTQKGFLSPFKGILW